MHRPRLRPGSNSISGLGGDTAHDQRTLDAIAFGEIAAPAKQLYIVERTCPALAERDDMIKFQIACRAALNTLTLVTLPNGCFYFLGDMTAFFLASLWRKHLPLIHPG